MKLDLLTVGNKTVLPGDSFRVIPGDNGYGSITFVVVEMHESGKLYLMDTLEYKAIGKDLSTDTNKKLNVRGKTISSVVNYIQKHTHDKLYYGPPATVEVHSIYQPR